MSEYSRGKERGWLIDSEGQEDEVDASMKLSLWFMQISALGCWLEGLIMDNGAEYDKA